MNGPNARVCARCCWHSLGFRLPNEGSLLCIYYVLNHRICSNWYFNVMKINFIAGDAQSTPCIYRLVLFILSAGWWQGVGNAKRISILYTTNQSLHSPLEHLMDDASKLLALFAVSQNSQKLIASDLYYFPRMCGFSSIMVGAKHEVPSRKIKI